METDKKQYILTAQCKSVIGTVDAVTHFLFEQQCYINELQSFDDSITGQFFIRAAYTMTATDEAGVDAFRAAFEERAAKFGMQWQVADADAPTRLLVLVSKFDHCLNDLLYRYRTSDLNIEIPAIISNHPDLAHLAESHGIPYFHLPVNKDNRPEQEARIRELFETNNCDLMVLARYMQVLSLDMCQEFSGRAINIHHSLLPGFKGARPYHQAFEKGVKLVGATAHFVTSDLDEGPIIAQGLETVDHTHTPEKLIAKGRDIESLTLSRAIRAYSQRHVFMQGSKTVVFPEG